MSESSGRQTVALGMPERIRELRGVIARIRAARQRYLELDLDPKALPLVKEAAQVNFSSWKREFSGQWETVEAVLDYFEKPEVEEQPQEQKVEPAPAHRPRVEFRKTLVRGGRPRRSL